jgi:hypothetical protein
MNERYSSEVVRERVTGRPVLAEGEVLEYEGKHGFPPMFLIGGIILSFIPPFFWGIGVVLLLWYQKKHDGVWVTNQRLINFDKVPFTQKYNVTSIPLRLISKIRRHPFDPLGILELLLRPIDKLLGVDDLQVFVKGSMLVKCEMDDIKGAGKLISHVRSKTGAEG